MQHSSDKISLFLFKGKILTVISIVLLLFTGKIYSQTMNLKTGSNVYISEGAILKVNNGLTLDNGAQIEHSAADSSTLYFSGVWTNNGSYLQNGYGILAAAGGIEDTVAGTSPQIFERFYIAKSDPTKKVTLGVGTDMEIEHSLRLISNNIFNINASDLIINEDAMIYADLTSTYTNDPIVDPFSESKHISTNGTFNSSGKIIRKLPNLGTINSDLLVRFPIGTPDDTLSPTDFYYTPARMNFYAGDVTFTSNADISMRCIASEHPFVLVSDVSLRKYWTVDANNINVMTGGYNIRFDYNQDEVQGDEDQYLLCLFYRSNTYFINAGSGYGVEPINNRFRVDDVNQENVGGDLEIAGDWTAGQEEAVSNFFYSINDGDFFDASNWSQEGYGGAPATTFPQTVNDKVFIGDGKSITITNQATNYLYTLRVQNTGRLDLIGNNAFVQGDSLVVEDGATLGISSQDGISALPAITGNIRTDTARIFSSNATYIYNGTSDQITGDGLPDILSSLIIENTGLTDSTVSLSKSVQIRDSLVIRNGKFHLFLNGTFSANGETGDTTGRQFIMHGGEIFCQTFPQNYKAPIFSAGTVTFDGTGSVTIPSSQAPVPGETSVLQYNNLKIRGNRGENTYVTLDPTDEIRIGGNLDISGLQFAANPVSERFLVTGSNVVFNGMNDQIIQTGYPAPASLEYRMKFHDLTIDGSGTKTLADPNDSDPLEDYVLVRNNVYLKNATLSTDVYDMRVLFSWITSPGASFNPGSGTVTFVADGKTTEVTSEGIVFNDVVIDGTPANGYVDFLDSLTVGGDLLIDPANLRDLNNSGLALLGDFTNQGTFHSNQGMVYFRGAGGDQQFINNGKGVFYDIIVNKTVGNVTIDGDSTIKVTNKLELLGGNIGGRNSASVINKPIIVDGSIIRSGGNPGHIDGRLRLPFGEDSDSQVYPVGLNDDYSPVTMDIIGFGGAPGYVDLFTDVDINAPNVDRDVIATDTPDGAALDTAKNIRKIWSITPDTTLAQPQRFQLGASRTYDLTFEFPPSDTVGRGNALNFEGRRRDSTENTGNWTRPSIAARNPLSIELNNLNELPNTCAQYFMVGEPQVFTFYSIADGNWNSPATWSTAGYNSVEAALRPPASFDNLRIGDGKIVDLNVNHTVDANRSVRVEVAGASNSNGRLNLGSNIISGSGSFILDSGAALGIGHQEGIVNSGGNGNIRTSVRDYNYNNHNHGHFIYTRDGSQSTGNGLPAIMMTLKVDKASGTLTFPGSTVIKQVWDSLYFANGDVDLDNVIMKLAGNFRLGATATFDPGTDRNNQAFSSTPPSTASVDTLSLEGGFTLNGSKTQFIYREGADTTSPIIFNRFSLSKQGGTVISKNNIEVPQLIIHPVNRVNLDMRAYNKYINVYDQNGGTYNVLRVGRGGGSEGDPGFDSLHVPKYGWVDGRLIRYFSAGDGGRIFPVGTQDKYSPVELQRNIGSSSGAVSGLIEVQAINGNHPLFDSTQINENTNIERYWEITPPVGLTPALSMGDRTLRARLIFTSDEPRGGIDPLNDYTVFRLKANDDWTDSENINFNSAANLTGPDFFELITDINTPSLGGNNIFSAQSEFSSANSITLMVGESPAGIVERIFYSRQSGPWTDPETWSYSETAYENTDTGYALDNPITDYPRLNNGTNRDLVYVGDDDRVVLDTSDFQLAFVQVEKSSGGMGTLSFPGENYFRTAQYVQKNGGKIEIGSVDGIREASQTNGNIRQISGGNIINFDWNALGVNNFEYIGNADQVQNTGDGLPQTMASLTINNTGNQYVNIELNYEPTIKDSLVFLSGLLRHRDGNRNITLLGDFVNHSDINLFESLTNRSIYIAGDSTQYIKGDYPTSEFIQKVYVNKSDSNIVQTNNTRFLDSLVFYTNTIYSITDNDSLMLGPSGYFGSVGDNFGVNRMVKLSAGTNTARVGKEFATGNNADRYVMFPVGEDSLGLRTKKYNEAIFDLNSMDFAASSNFILTLRSEYPHPNAMPGAEILSKYWSVETNNIALNNGSLDLQLKYNDSEINGNILDFLPTLYRRADVTPEDPGWSFKLFNASLLDIDTLNKHIIVNGARTLPNHDWTAAAPTSFTNGKVYWSISSGDWSDPNTWTNYNNLGNPHGSAIPALNSPGYFENDTVFISSDHAVEFNQTPQNPIDSLGVGVTLPVNGPELRFISNPAEDKSLSVLNSVIVDNDGLIQKNAGVSTNIDTLFIGKDLINNSSGAGTGFDLFDAVDRHVRLVFNSANDSHVQGEGNYVSLGSTEVLKADSVYNFHNESQSFSAAVSVAVLSDPNIGFYLNAGQYYHDNPADITLTADGDGELFLGALVGMVVNDGNVIFEDGLVCGKNASVWLVDGNMSIGNDIDENFSYESVTIIDIAGNSELRIAGNLRRRFLTSAVDFRIKQNALIEVMKSGAVTNSAERRGGFDFGEANSLFSMTGGRVVIMKPMDLSPAFEKDPDYIVSSANYTVTGGTVQIGDEDSTFASVEPFNIISSVPFWNLDIANTYGEELTLGSNIMTIRNDLLVRDDGIVSQNGQNVVLGGDFTLDGTWSTGALGTRRFTFNGNNTYSNTLQTLKIKDNSAGTPFFDVVISKSDSGSVALSTDPLFPNSNIILENTLEFATGNRGLIVADTSVGRYVQVGTNNADLASVQRFGKGYVAGELRRWIADGAQNKTFHVGTQEAYTPVTLEISSGAGSPGLIGVTGYGTSHPDLANNPLFEIGTDIERYWRIVPQGSSPFDLGAGRNYNLNTQFIAGFEPTGDIKSGSNFGVFEHFRRTDAWEQAGTWNDVPALSRTDSTLKSGTISEFGDFMVAEPAGITYYSRKNGAWNDASTWSNIAYGGVAAPDWPNTVTDRVRIGNGDTVVISSLSPRARTITVEKFNDKPGMLFVQNERWLRGLSFELKDSCILATDEPYGFTALGGFSPNIGAIRTTSSRVYGEGIFEFRGLAGQVIGDGPHDAQKIIIDNQGVVTNSVSMSTSSVRIVDSLIVLNGELRMGQSNITLEGDKFLAFGTRMQGQSGTLTINGVDDQYFYYGNDEGASIYNLIIDKPDSSLFIDGALTTNNLRIINDLNFAASNVGIINTRDNDQRIILRDDTTTISRLGEGHVDGIIQRPYGTGAGSFKFELGVVNDYTPMTLDLSTGGSGGDIQAIAFSPVTVSGGNRINPDRKVDYWWQAIKTDTTTIGTDVNVKLQFPASEMANINQNDAWLRHLALPAQSPAWDQVPGTNLTWNAGEASALITNPADYLDELGNFYIGEKSLITYYSRQDGPWTDPNTWTLDPSHVGPPLSAGEFPNPSPSDTLDNVYIGLNHIVALDTVISKVDSLIVRNDSKLDMITNIIECAGCTAAGKGLFDLRDNATIAFANTSQPSNTTTLVSFTDYVLSPLSTIEFYGIQDLTDSPFGFLTYPNNVLVSGVGTKTVSVPLIIEGNLTIEAPALLNINADALSVYQNVINSGTINNQQILEIGQ